MKLESITVENYRQFEKAELTFDEGITILAGANNSGKTSLINLIKNIFVDDKLNYNMSDIPAKNMREWVEWVYPIFQKFFRDRKTEENVEKDLLNVVIPKEETDSTHLMKMTTVKIHVSYNPDDIDGYYLGESSQGLGYSNMIYIHLQLKEYEKNIDPLKVNMFFLEEPESHMHPQMQQVFIKYLLDYYESKLQGLITTHSNEMVRVAGISHLRVIRHVGNFKSELYDLSILVKDLKKSEEMEDKELANFFDWFFEIGYSEIVFADRAIFYEGDTERLYIRKVMTLEKYKKLKQQYVAFIQVGGAYAKNYEKLIKLLGIKSLIITDIDYGKSEIVIEDVKKSKTTNATIEYFYSINNSTDTPTVEELYSWKETGGNIIEDLIYVCFQTKDDGYARTLEEAMINKYFDMDVSKCYKKSDWKEKRKDSELKFSIPRMKNKKEIADDDMVSVRDILAATSGNKTDFMCSVIMKDYVKKMLPDYIERGLEWLMK